MTNSARLKVLGLVLGLTTLRLEATPAFVSIDFPGAVVTVAVGINPAGEIVGTYELGLVKHGYLLSKEGFTRIDFPRAAQTSANGINPAGNIVGAYFDSAGAVHGFL